jgi:hypothetical protein
LAKRETCRNSSPQAEIYARRSELASAFLPCSKTRGRVKKEIKNREGS